MKTNYLRYSIVAIISATVSLTLAFVFFQSNVRKQVITIETSNLVQNYSILLNLNTTNTAVAINSINRWMDVSILTIDGIDPNSTETNAWNMIRKIKEYRKAFPQMNTTGITTDIFEKVR